MIKTITNTLLFLYLSLTHICAYELGVVTLFRNEANYLKEWIEYHRMLGVDHFLLYNDRSIDNWAEVLHPYIRSGLVEVTDWHKDEDTPLFPTWQIMAYKDGMRKSKGNTKWLAFIDVDEFILPKKNTTIIEFLDLNFPNASGFYVPWRNFGTGGIFIDPGKPILTHLTACSPQLHSRNASGKSIVKVEDILIDETWSPHQIMLKEGSQYYDGGGHPLYFQGTDLQICPYHRSDYIQINHYVMRDENFFRNVRLPKAISMEYGQLSLLKEHYENFNTEQDYQMIEFLKNKHPIMYEIFWHEVEGSNLYDINE